MSSDTDRPDTDEPSADRPEHGADTPAAPADPSPTAESPKTSAAAAETAATQSAGADANTASAETITPHSETHSAATSTGNTRDSSQADAESPDPASEATDTDSGPQLHPALIATAVALPVALIIAVLVIAAMSRQSVDREPLALSAIDAPAGNSPDCVNLLGALPESLGDDYTRSEFAQPAPPATAAWQLPDGGDPIVLRCGLQRPQEFDRASALQVVNGVNWFEIRDQTSGVTSGTWYAVDRGIYVAVTMPNKAGPSPLQEISDTIADRLPAKPLDPAPVPN
ncbi:DUF3515 domain-containing protein [Nocardia nova]|uniref:DUF3515 domain-containing protein n=1 Tax=Nocardia nova TaxID=37330 RepID=UPI0033E6C0B2